MTTNMNILVTGASGFVGSHLAKHLADKGDNVIGIIRDQIPSSWLADALNDVIKVRGDIRDLKLVKRTVGHYDIDQVYHLAASAQVKHAWKNPWETYENNVMGTISVLDTVRQINKDIDAIVLNTDKVYGERLNATENDCYVESEPYATSKCCQGLIVKSYIKTYDMDNLRMAHSVNIFGFDPWNSRLISNVVKNCIKGIKPIIWTNDKSIREYVYIDDVVQGLERIMNNERNDNIFHIHTGYVFNQEDVILNILENFYGLEAEYEPGKLVYQIQKETLESVNWDWRPSISFDEGIKKTISMFRYYSEDWDKIDRSDWNK